MSSTFKLIILCNKELQFAKCKLGFATSKTIVRRTGERSFSKESKALSTAFPTLIGFPKGSASIAAFSTNEIIAAFEKVESSGTVREYDLSN